MLRLALASGLVRTFMTRDRTGARVSTRYTIARRETDMGATTLILPETTVPGSSRTPPPHPGHCLAVAGAGPSQRTHRLPTSLSLCNCTHVSAIDAVASITGMCSNQLEYFLEERVPETQVQREREIQQGSGLVREEVAGYPGLDQQGNGACHRDVHADRYIEPDKVTGTFHP